MTKTITITAKAQKWCYEHGERNLDDIQANKQGLYVLMYKPSMWKGVESSEMVYLPEELPQ